MKIRLTCDPPVVDRHGMTEGRVLDVIRSTPPEKRTRGCTWWFVMGDAGEEVGILRREATILAATPEKDTP